MKKKIFTILTLVLMLCSLLIPQLVAFANDGGYLYDVYVCTSDGFLNMREEPNTDSRVLYALPDCANLEVSYVSGNWGYAYYSTENDHYSGWIYLPATKPTYREARDNAGHATDDIVYVNAPNGHITLRSEPTTTYNNVYCKIPNNTELQLIRKTDKDWALTTFDSYTGWIALSGTQTEPMVAPEEEEEEKSAHKDSDAITEDERESSSDRDIFLFDNPFLMFALGGLLVLLIVLIITLLIMLSNRKKSASVGTSAYPTYPPYAPTQPKDTYKEPYTHPYDQRNQ